MKAYIYGIPTLNSKIEDDNPQQFDPAEGAASSNNSVLTKFSIVNGIAMSFKSPTFSRMFLGGPIL